MRGLDKWRKDTLFRISEMDFYDALHFIEDEYYHKCDYCAYKDRCDEADDCTTGIKEYLCGEALDERYNKGYQDGFKQAKFDCEMDKLDGR